MARSTEIRYIRRIIELATVAIREASEAETVRGYALIRRSYLAQLEELA